MAENVAWQTNRSQRIFLRAVLVELVLGCIADD